MLTPIKNLLARKDYALVISILYTLSLLLVSLMNLKGLPDKVVDDGDKIFHFLAYFALTLLWYNTFIRLFNWSFFKTILVVFVSSVLFGIVIEYLQGVLTSFRTPDIKDILANTLGVLVAVLLTKFVFKAEVKKM